MRVVLLVVLWFILHMICVYICHKIPDHYYSPGLKLFVIKPFEKDGKMYERLFKIKSWKNLLPDGGSINSYGFQKRKIVKRDASYFEKFIIETKRAELIHWTGILTSTIFLFIFSYPWNMVFYLISVVADLPFIFIQRYNRPRLMKLVRRKENL